MTIQDIPGVDLDAVVGLKPEPAAPASTALVTSVTSAVNNPNGQEAFSCRDQLSPALQGKAHEAAKQWLPLIVENPNRLAEVGNQAVDEINAAGERLFHLFLSDDRVKIPELTQYTKDLDREVRGFRRSHDSNQKRNLDQYDQFKNKVVEFMNRNKDWLRELISDAKGLERRMDGIVAKIVDKQAQLVRNVEECNNLYAVNEQAIVKLVFATAAMEYLRDEAAAAAAAIVVTPGAPDERTKREQRDIIVTLVQQIEVRISEFKQRLFVAVATSPQIRNIRTLNYGLSQRLAMIITLTIPVFKLTVVQWAMAIEAQQGADMTSAAADFNNATLEAWASSAKEAVPAMAKVIQTPSTSPEAILAVADSLVAQFQGFDDAYRSGIQQRQAVDAAITKGFASISASADKRAVLLQDLVRANKPLELPAAPSLPSVVIDNAKEAITADQNSSFALTS